MTWREGVKFSQKPKQPFPVAKTKREASVHLLSLKPGPQIDQTENAIAQVRIIITERKGARLRKQN